MILFYKRVNTNPVHCVSLRSTLLLGSEEDVLSNLSRFCERSCDGGEMNVWKVEANTAAIRLVLYCQLRDAAWELQKREQRLREPATTSQCFFWMHPLNLSRGLKVKLVKETQLTETLWDKVFILPQKVMINKRKNTNKIQINAFF